MNLLIQVSYYAAAFLFIMGLKRMSSPVTAASGIKWAGAGMVVATVITFAYPDLYENSTADPQSVNVRLVRDGKEVNVSRWNGLKAGETEFALAGTIFRAGGRPGIQIGSDWNEEDGRYQTLRDLGDGSQPVAFDAAKEYIANEKSVHLDAFEYRLDGGEW